MDVRKAYEKWMPPHPPTVACPAVRCAVASHCMGTMLTYGCAKASTSVLSMHEPCACAMVVEAACRCSGAGTSRSRTQSCCSASAEEMVHIVHSMTEQKVQKNELFNTERHRKCCQSCSDVRSAGNGGGGVTRTTLPYELSCRA